MEEKRNNASGVGGREESTEKGNAVQNRSTSLDDLLDGERVHL